METMENKLDMGLDRFVVYRRGVVYSIVKQRVNAPSVLDVYLNHNSYFEALLVLRVKGTFFNFGLCESLIMFVVNI